MKFIKYSSIENGYRKLFIDYIKEHLDFNDVTWQVTEKIDGSHLSIIVDCDTMETRYAKRSCITDDTFMSCGVVADKYLDSAKMISEEITMLNSEICIDTIQIELEIFGQGIQNRVVYGAKDVVAYDIRITGVRDDKLFPAFLDPLEVVELCDRFGMPHAPILADGLSFDDAMAFNIHFNSAIKDGVENNYAEGVVLKPSKVMYLGNGNRVVIKNKSDKFKERMKSKRVKREEIWTDRMNDVYETINQYINHNRLRSAISKIGTITNKDFGKLMKIVSLDVLDDWAKDYEWDVDKKEQKSITKKMNREISNLIRENFLNIIDGVY